MATRTERSILSKKAYYWRLGIWNDRIVKWWRLEGTSRNLVGQPPCSEQGQIWVISDLSDPGLSGSDHTSLNLLASPAWYSPGCCWPALLWGHISSSWSTCLPGQWCALHVLASFHLICVIRVSSDCWNNCGDVLFVLKCSSLYRVLSDCNLMWNGQKLIEGPRQFSPSSSSRISTAVVSSKSTCEWKNILKFLDDFQHLSVGRIIFLWRSDGSLCMYKGDIKPSYPSTHIC